jgi:hypothetical protein
VIRLFTRLAGLSCLAVWLIPTAHAQSLPREFPGGAVAELLCAAPADEYFYGLGNPSNTFIGAGIDLSACETNGSAPKVNQAYVWGMGKSGSNLFFGTMANTDTLVLSGYLRQTNPALNYYRAAEYGSGIFGRLMGLPGAAGDWRPPRLYRVDLVSGVCHDLATMLPPADRARLGGVLGFRAGGAVPPSSRNPEGLAVLAGPMLQATRGCAFFFFKGTTGEFLGSVENPRYTNIRRFVEMNGDLYSPVQLADGSGAVIRWINDPAHTNYPFRMSEVGALDQGGADICKHEGRLFVTTWPSLLERAQLPGSTVTAEDLFMKAVGLWMSPVVPATGLSKSSRWVKVWNVNDYETDKVIAASYGGGALASFDGWLYFGTLNVPFLSTLVHAIASGDYQQASNSTPAQQAAYLVQMMPKTHRATALFRGRNFREPLVLAGVTLSAGGEFQLLYGYTNLWTFDLESKTWSLEPNNMEIPRMGGPGFGNINNCYTWVMEVFQNDLYLGTLDINFPGTADDCAVAATNPATTVGGDLLRLPSSRAEKFESVSLNGLGNPANYGFRTMVSERDALYIGTANPRNLLVGQPGLPEGGWELLRFTKAKPVPYDQDGDRKADFTVASPATGSLTMWLSFGGGWTNRLLPAGSALALADYDGDGKTDAGSFNPVSGSWTCWLSSRRLAKWKATQWANPEGLIPVPADLDGDGNADCAVWRAGDSSLAWLSSRTKTISMVRPPVHPALPALGDYDGNGRVEPAWYVPSSGRWYRQPKAGKAVEQVPVMPRIKSSIPMPADFTGDGKTDFAVYEPASGLIHMWDALTKAYQTAGPKPRGWIPACADYDGDGTTDMAWYHAKTRQLTIVYSGSSTEDTLDLSAGLPAGCRPVMAPGKF